MSFLPALRAVGLPLGVAVLVLAADCAGTGLDCDPATVINLTLGVRVDETLDAKHCVSGDDPGDLYQFTLAQQTTFLVTVGSDKFSPEFGIARLPATSQDAQVVFAFGKPARAFAFLPAGQYALDVQSSDNSMGTYFLNTELIQPTGCTVAQGVRLYVATGMTVSGTFAPTDCLDNGIAIREMYEVYLLAGHAYSFTLKAATPRLFLDVVDLATSNGVMVASSGTFATNGTTTVTYTPTATRYYGIGVSPGNGNTNAAYTLEISQ